MTHAATATNAASARPPVKHSATRDRLPGTARHRLRHRARVWCGTGYTYLGLHATEEQAGRVAARARVILHGSDPHGIYDGSPILLRERLSVWRRHRCLSEARFARLTGQTEESVQAVEAGQVEVSVPVLIVYAEVLGLDLDRLVGRKREGSP